MGTALASPNDHMGGTVSKDLARTALLAGSVIGFVSVAGGAFGAHALKAHLAPDLLAIFDTGVRYAMLHASALLACGLLALHAPTPGLRWAVRTFIAGVIVFTGSLWLLALLDQRWLGAITPLGGLSFLLGWVMLGREAAATGRATRPGSTGPGSS